MTFLMAAVVAVAGCGGVSRRSPPPTPASMSVVGPDLAAKPGEASRFEATGHYPDGSIADLTGWARWDSSNPSVAAAAPGGMVTALAPGQARIGATYGRLAASAPFMVVPAAAASRPRIASGRSAARSRDVEPEPSRPESAGPSSSAPATSGSAPARGAPGGSAAAPGGGGAPSAAGSQQQVHDWRGTLTALGRGIWADVTLATDPVRREATSLNLGRASLYAVWVVFGGMIVVGSLRQLLHGRSVLGPLLLLPFGACVILIGPILARISGEVYEFGQIATVVICLVIALPALSLTTYGSRGQLFRQSRRFYLWILGGFLVALLWAVWSLDRNPPLG